MKVQCLAIFGIRYIPTEVKNGRQIIRYKLISITMTVPITVGNSTTKTSRKFCVLYIIPNKISNHFVEYAMCNAYNQERSTAWAKIKEMLV